jgi:hypothetical protein
MMRMVNIFISHSSKDTDILGIFDKVFAGTNVHAIRAEFESYNIPPWNAIKEWIEESSALFLLIGPNLKSSDYTQNWVSFEVGLAAGKGKEIWVFEQQGREVHFPVPYLDHYMLYDAGKANADYIRSVIDAYGNGINVGGAALAAIVGYAIAGPAGGLLAGLIGSKVNTSEKPVGLKITCPYADCCSAFQLHSRLDNLDCPSCRRNMIVHWPQ